MLREIQYNPIFDAQRHFRVLLDAMARPGKLVPMHDVSLSPPSGLALASALVGFALLDSHTTYWVHASYEEARLYLQLNTGAENTQIPQADFIFCQPQRAIHALEHAKTGTLLYPETGATLILHTSLLSANPLNRGIRLDLEGPGVKGIQPLFIEGTEVSFFKELRETNSEFPLGVDTILVDAHNKLACLPRSNRFSIHPIT